MTPQRIKRQILGAIQGLQGEDESSVIDDTRVAERTGIELRTVRDYMESIGRSRTSRRRERQHRPRCCLDRSGQDALGKKPRRSSPKGRKMTHAEIRHLILQTIQNNQPNSGISVQDSVIAEKTGLSVQEVQDHLDVLEEKKNVQLAITTGGHGAWLTRQGRLGLQEQPEKVPDINMSTMSTDSIQRLILATINDGQGQNVTDSDIAMKTGLKPRSCATTSTYSRTRIW